MVAVYGTLKTGESNHERWMRAATLIDTGQTKLQYPMLVSGIPYVFDCPGQGGNIIVEVYRVSMTEIVNRLDHLEGHPHFYCRKPTAIVLDNGEEVTAWLYFINGKLPDDAKLYTNYTRSGSH